MIWSSKTFRLVLILLMLKTCAALADDVGITKARLIQETDRSYVVEADVTQQLVWAIKAPIFPDRFRVSELEYVTQSGWIVVRARAETAGAPLSAEDRLLLPWARNGVDLSVQWLDGDVRKGLFLRSLEGIDVPVRLLMSSTRSLGEICFEHFLHGLSHFRFMWIHLVLVVILVLYPSPFRSLLIVTFGHGVSLICVDVGFPGFSLIFADVLLAVSIFLLACSGLSGMRIERFFPVLFLLGLIHGVSYAQELSRLDLDVNQRLPALFMFNASIDIAQVLLAFLLIPGVRFLEGRMRFHKAATYSAGVFSVVVIAVIFQHNVSAGRTDVLGFGNAQNLTQYSLPTAPNTQAGGQRPQGARQLTSPIMSYLSIEPYEVRQEVLVQARAAVQFLGVDDSGKASIPQKSLEPVKTGILEVVREATVVSIDGETPEPIVARADFVTLGPAGVVLREVPVPESLDQGIIGLTFVYETKELASEVRVRWQLFSALAKKVEITAIDPFGGATTILSPESNTLRWERRLTGYRVPVVKEIVVEKRRLPVVSVLLFLFSLAAFGYSVIRGEVLVQRSILVSTVGLGLLLYPFLRSPLDVAFVNRWTPSIERTSMILDDLLTNVYRSFDLRNENDVYDRLAISVDGDQLTQIYLESRRSLEFENRGAARASVDEVEIQSIGGVRRSDDEFVADVNWTVAGSVNHFGHTHYRRNRYHAIVSFAAIDGAWKITGMELLEEERLL